MTHSPLTRHSERTRASIDLLPDASLVQARVHEACGPGRVTFAFWLAAQMQGPILWIRPTWLPETLCPDGIFQRMKVEPRRLLFANVSRAEDLLWSMEEGLRSGAAPLVVAELPVPPGLTPVRRLHLAAETGAAEGAAAPVGLMLTPVQTDREGEIIGGAAGVETRWHVQPRHKGAQQSWRLTRLRARMAPQKYWHVKMGKTGLVDARSEAASEPVA